MRSKKVFVSYAREDTIAARKLVAKIDSLKLFRVWFDERSLVPGQNWAFEINQAISNADLFIALISQHSVSKQGVVQKELRQAIDILETLPPGAVYLIPVRLDECYPLHPYLSKIHWIDLFPDWEKGVSQLAKGLLSQILNQDDFIEVDLCEVVRKSVDMIRNSIIRDYTFSLNIHNDHLPILGNESQLTQAHINILLNTIDFGDMNEPINIHVYKSGTTAFVKIIDIGEYIPEINIHENKIFEPFFTTKAESATGLGLTITSSIIERHWGTIFVNSTPIASDNNLTSKELRAVTTVALAFSLVTDDQRSIMKR